MNTPFSHSLRTPNVRDVPSDQIQLYEVTFGERIDQIAAKMYGHEAYWRVIAEFNGLTDAANLGTGQLLQIPHRSLVEEVEL